MFKFAGVIVNNISVQVDKIFLYSIPQKFLDVIEIGLRVKVPFGIGNKQVDGFVIELYEENLNENTKIKEILEVCDSYSLLRPLDIKLVEFMRINYLCTYLEAIKTIIPPGIFNGMKSKTNRVIYVSKELEGKYNKEPYINIYCIVKENNGKLNRNELNKKFGLSLSSMNTLIKLGFLADEKVIINRYDIRDYEQYSPKVLNEEQQNAINTIHNFPGNNYLIHGITGSGKTEIYMSLVSEALSKNMDSIILVPEISLTPQMVERFKGRFGKDIAIFHSKLSEGERFDEWLRVKNGLVKVAIGARSAVFLPFNNLSLIVIDEEHENSYKSDGDPKYLASEIAQYRCELENAKLILGSATPSVETYYKALDGKLKLITLNKRADTAVLPSMELVDMRQELLLQNKSIFSKRLYEEIETALQNNEQIILFLNRRGYSTFVSCRQCGFVFKCNKCDIALTYHQEDNSLTCHYCGMKRRATNTCPKCKSNYVKFFGIGTEKIEREVRKYFPKARTLRMDFDTTRKKNAYEDIYTSFKKGEADILIGTQMIAKGLDFKDVTVVGVLAADLSLNVPDFRSAERTFQLITQVAGRAGRGEKPGRVIVQTYSPDNYSIVHSINSDYISFFKEEISIRKDMSYPPYSKIYLINMTSKKEELLIKNIQNIGVLLKNMLIEHDTIEILGPCPCSISKINDFYRWQIILKGNINLNLANNIKNMIYDALKEVYADIRLSLDLNPLSLL